MTTLTETTPLDVDLDAVVPCQFREAWEACTGEATLRGRKDCCPTQFLACESCADVVTKMLTTWYQQAHGTTAPCVCGGRTATLTWRPL